MIAVQHPSWIKKIGLTQWLAVLLLSLLAMQPARAFGQTDPKKPAPVLPDDDLNPRFSLPTEPGDHRLSFKTHIDDREVVIPYVLHFPANYATDSRKKAPVLVFFHGIGERGNDLGGVYALGPMTWLKSDGGNPAFTASCPFIFIGPQCPVDSTWDNDYMYKACVKLIRQVINHSRADADRVYATGLSMGGLGSWCVAEEAPDLFAAIAPLSAMAFHPEQAAEKLKYISIWAVAGNNDQPRFIDGCHAMNAALSHHALVDRWTYFVDKGHEAWWPPFQNIDFYEWFLNHRRLTPAQKKKLDQQHAPPATQPLPTVPGHYFLSHRVMFGNQPLDMDYLLYIPRGYKPTGPARPVMLYLQEQDVMGPVYHDVCMHGPDLELEKKTALQNNFPFVVISPKPPLDCDWDHAGMTAAILNLIDTVSTGINIDPRRISVTGVNIGAVEAYHLASEAPDRFSAVTAVIADGQFTPRDEQAAVMKALPGRVFLTPSETESAARFTQIIGQNKTDWKVQKLPIGSSPLSGVSCYSDHQYLQWLFEQRRTAAPVALGAK